jgi:hypothetical protein
MMQDSKITFKISSPALNCLKAGNEAAHKGLETLSCVSEANSTGKE